MSRLTALIAHNRVGASARNVSTLLAAVAHGLILALTRLVSGLLASAAHNLVLAVLRQMAGLQTAVAGVVRHEAAESRTTAHSMVDGRTPTQPFTLLSTRRSLRTITSNVSGLVAEATNYLISSGLLAEVTRESKSCTWEQEQGQIPRFRGCR